MARASIFTAELTPREELVRLAEHCAAIEKYYKTDEIERIRSIGFALLECVDFAIENGLIAHDDTNLPPYITPILANVYAFLGDPL
jgi:hypothetical protein